MKFVFKAVFLAVTTVSITNEGCLLHYGCPFVGLDMPTLVA